MSMNLYQSVWDSHWICPFGLQPCFFCSLIEPHNRALLYVACMGGELEEVVVRGGGMSVIKGAQVSSWLIMRWSAPRATFCPSVCHRSLVCVKGFTIGW